MSDETRNEHADSIGLRIKSLRRSAGLSQAVLGNTLGVTFQQVQKYESGQSRIAADKLQRIAQALSVDVSYFYGEPPEAGPSGPGADPAGAATSPEAARFQDAFDRIKDPRARYLLAELARVFAEIEAGR